MREASLTLFYGKGKQSTESRGLFPKAIYWNQWGSSWQEWSSKDMLSPKDNKGKDMLLTLHANWITPLKNFCQKTSPPQITPEDAPTADICSRQNHRSWMEVGAGMGLLSGLCYTSRACSTRLTLKRGSNTSRDCSCSTEWETSLQRLETRH